MWRRPKLWFLLGSSSECKVCSKSRTLSNSKYFSSSDGPDENKTRLEQSNEHSLKKTALRDKALTRFPKVPTRKDVQERWGDLAWSVDRYNSWERDITRPGVSLSSPETYDLLQGLTVLPGDNDEKPLKPMLKEEFFLGPLERQGLSVPRDVDQLIIGGGLIGTAIAYFLLKKSRGHLRVAVVERDSTYKSCSSTLNVGGIRQQFSCEENVLMSLFGIGFLKNIRNELSIEGDDFVPESGFVPCGYLSLATEETAPSLEADHRMQIRVGAKTVLLNKDELQQRFPWLNVDNVALGCYGMEEEGYFDSWSVMTAMRRKAMSMGCNFIQGEVLGFESMTRRASQWKPKLLDTNLDRALVYSPMDGYVYTMRASNFINAAGPWAGQLASRAGIGEGLSTMSVSLPVEPRKRFVYSCHAPDGPGLDCPLVLDTTGVYFRRDGMGANFLCGACPLPGQAEPSTKNLDVDESWFYDHVWPNIANRCNSFENLKLCSSWAGYYEYNYCDQNLIIGRHPVLHNFIFANGSSGHGIQHSFCIGNALSELLLDGQYKTLDLSRLCFGRVTQLSRCSESRVF